VIVRPSTGQLLRAVRRELLAVVAPAVDDPGVSVSIEMMASVLLVASQRADHEAAWLCEECEAIESVATSLQAELPTATALAQALESYRRQRAESGDLADIRADYERASEVLSRAAEAAVASGDRSLEAAVVDLLERRVAQEMELMGGEWKAVGRG
jgi:methylthioribose-1-phosphate isomerase